MKAKPKAKASKKKIDVIRRQKTEKCQVICICSMTSTIHVLVPILKVLNRLGTVQVISEDKSTMLLSDEINSTFEVGDIRVELIDEIIMLPDEVIDTFKEYNYNIIITHDFLPDFNIDKFIILNRRHHFREQIDTVEKRYTPIFSAFDGKVLKKDEREKEKEVVYVNERLIDIPPYAVCQDYLNTLMMGVGSKDFRVNTKLINFVTEALNGIEGCTKQHIKRILMERGEMFVSFS